MRKYFFIISFKICICDADYDNFHVGNFINNMQQPRKLLTPDTFVEEKKNDRNLPIIRFSLESSVNVLFCNQT